MYLIMFQCLLTARPQTLWTSSVSAYLSMDVRYMYSTCCSRTARPSRVLHYAQSLPCAAYPTGILHLMDYYIIIINGILASFMTNLWNRSCVCMYIKLFVIKDEPGDPKDWTRRDMCCIIYKLSIYCTDI